MADGSRSPDAMDLNAIASALGITKRSAERRATKENWPFESRAARGGAKRYYTARSLPADVQAALFLRAGAAVPADAEIERVRRRNTAATTSAAQIQSAWQRYEAVPQHLKDEAMRRLRALQAVEQLVADGRALMDARALVAAQLQRENMRGVSAASLGRWAAQVAGVEKQHRLAMLVPAYTGRTATTEIPSEAWDLFKADYLRVEAPTAAKCYERLQRIACVKGWAIPSLKTFQRRIQAELPRGVLILARLGQEAFDRTFPAQERDRTVFHALEAVNSDGHKFDVFVRWPDGTVARPIMVGVQDLYSGKLLGWRVAETESADLARFAFRDVIERYGIPAKVWLDNGRGFASKLLTGGTANRFRFKVREDDPTGLLTGMGCEIHWATPYHGQAKPIERAWRDLCESVAKHPAFAGAYTGNKPDAKPENYGSKAIALDEFVRVLNGEIAAHNNRLGRRTRAANGRSFNETFDASYAVSTIRKASAEQLRQMLLATEVVTSDSRDGAVRLAGNRYWSEAIAAHAGQKLMLRFDPERLHAEVQVYSLANVYIGAADCIAAVGFADTQAARDHARAKKQYRRATKQQLEAERRMDIASLAAQLPSPMPENLPAAGVVAPIFGRRAPAPQPEHVDVPLQRTGTNDHEGAFASLMERMAAQQQSSALWHVAEDEA
ncbi:transposase domain-containing protein [uncultured Xanthomonas sp.]|uniref:transposase domain-containing protein n=1 Tax=uncultured Xanthomonas sp. TaxID=152831 RepID=UPI0025E226D0|nr:transposase domain-containing protein [uncultured Xanthomonas sp.]